MVAEDKPHEFTVPLDRQQLIGVTYAKVEKTPLKPTVRAIGTVGLDRLRHWDYVSRVEGYVQKLYVTSPGQLVEKDQPLLSIYSPDLFASEREVVQLLETRDKIPGTRESTDRLIQSARRRLELWNITPEQIADACLGAAEAGAAIVHIHVRDPETGKPSMELDYYRDVVERIRAKNAQLILNITTGPGGRKSCRQATGIDLLGDLYRTSSTHPGAALGRPRRSR